MDDRLRVDHHVDPVVVDPEQLVRLDHLEALVHQGRRVDGDLLAHGPGGMVQRRLHGHGRQFVCRTTAERPTGSRQDDVGDPFIHVVGSQALVDGAVLAVDRQQFGPRGGPDPLDHRACGDQGLLVGQAQALPSGKGRQGDREACEADHPVDGHLRDDSGVGHRIRAGQDLGAVRYPCNHLGGQGGIGDGDHLGSEPGGLLDQHADRPCGADGHHVELVGSVGHDVERLGPDRAGRPEHGHRGRGHGASLPMGSPQAGTGQTANRSISLAV